eukprot:8975167-Prorocentrum_lima.AAC.1
MASLAMLRMTEQRKAEVVARYTQARRASIGPTVRERAERYLRQQNGTQEEQLAEEYPQGGKGRRWLHHIF